MLKVVVGICGIGMGHAMRQTPVIRTLLKKNAKIIVFSFGEALSYIKKTFPTVEAYEVFVPFIATNSSGILFKKTATEPINHNHLCLTHNFHIMQQAFDFFKSKPDLVITDYEPVSAQYAYGVNSPLITLDQQSKFLLSGFEDIYPYGPKEEADRLRFFFPSADKRFACSFFKVPQQKEAFDITIIPSFIREEIEVVQKLRAEKKEKKGILVYLSTFMPTKQTPTEIIDRLKTVDENFTIFTSNNSFLNQRDNLPPNITIYKSDKLKFNQTLSEVKGVISTGGHNLLSELMFLKIPTFVIPLANYEQHYSAKVIDKNGFGLSQDEINTSTLKYFIKNLTNFEQNIKQDSTVLYKKSGTPLLDEILKI